MISGKQAVFVSLVLALVFLAALLLWALCFAPAGQLRMAACPATQSALMTGGDDSSGTATELLPGELVNINTATAQQLQRLPGIGETLSEAIVAYREANGDFQQTEDIMDVPGIGQGRFSAIADNITVGD